MKDETVLAVLGTILMISIGWLIGTLIEHPPEPGNLPFLGALIGAMIALAVLSLGIALRS
jgi:hypothetical protein